MHTGDVDIPLAVSGVEAYFSVAHWADDSRRIPEPSSVDPPDSSSEVQDDVAEVAPCV